MSRRPFPVVAGLALAFLAAFLPMLTAPVAAESQPAAADRPVLEVGEGPFPYQLLTLPNGLRVVSLEDHTAPIAAVSVWYHVGAKNERPNRRGFAHMFEHMMFRGTERLANGEHDKYIKRAGGTMNAYTSFDETVYFQVIPAHELEMVMWLEAERMAFLQIDEEGFRTERDVVIEEYRLGKERPYGSAFDQALPQVFPGGLYSWSPIGSPEELRAATVAELQEFWNRHYVPNNATLLVIGAVEHAKVQEMAQRYFGWMPRFPEPPAPYVPEAPRGTLPARITIQEKKAPVPIAGIGWRTLPAGHPDALALSMAGSILGQGESSRLYRRLVVADDLATAAFAGDLTFQADGVTAVAAVLKPFGSDIDRTLAVLREEVARFIAEGPTEEEMTKALNAELRSLVSSRRTVMGQGRTLGQAIGTWGDLARVNRLEAEVRALTAADLQRVVAQYLDPAVATEVVIEQNLVGGLMGGIFGRGRQAEGTDTTAEVGEEGAAATEAAAAIPADAAVGHGKPGLVRPADMPATPPLAGSLDADLTIEAPSRRLANGLEVVVLEDAKVPMVTFLLGVQVGAAHDPADATGTAALAADMLSRGTANRDYEALSRELDLYALEFEASADREETTLSISGLVEHSDRALGLLADLLLHPAFPEAEFTMLTGQLRAQLAVEEKEGSYLADRALRGVLYAGHPYARPVRPELAHLDALTPERLRAWWAAHMQPSRATLYVVGDLAAADAFALAEKHLGAWADGAPIADPDWPAPAPIEGRRVVLVDLPGQQAQIRVAQHAFTRTSPDYIPSRVVSQVLGGGFNSRLVDKIRVELGLTYGAGGGFRADRRAGSLRVSTFTKNESVGQAVAAIYEVLDGMKTTPPDEDALVIARNTIVGDFVRSRETAMSKAISLWQVKTEGLPADFPTRVLRGVQATTAEDVVRVASAHIHPDATIVVVVGPAEELRPQLEAFGPVTVLAPME